MKEDSVLSCVYLYSLYKIPLLVLHGFKAGYISRKKHQHHPRTEEDGGDDHGNLQFCSTFDLVSKITWYM